MHEGHRARLRARFLREGLSGFEPHNALELLLFYTIPRCDTNELAHRLIDAFGSLNQVFDASYDDLLAIKGVGESTASLIKVVPAMHARCLQEEAQAAVLDSVEAVGKFLVARLTGLTHEELYVLCLDAQSRLLQCRCVSQGTVRTAETTPRLVLETAIQCHASAVVLAHNHPSGIAVPSADDVDFTREYADLFHKFDIVFQDHIIVADHVYFSMADHKKFCMLFS